MQEIKSRFHYENTKASAKQIIYLKFMDEIIPYQNVQMLKSTILFDLMSYS